VGAVSAVVGAVWCFVKISFEDERRKWWLQ